MKQNDAYVESALLTTRKEALSLYRAVIRASVYSFGKIAKATFGKMSSGKARGKSSNKANTSEIRRW